MSCYLTISAATRARPSAARSAAGARLFFLPPYSPDLNPIEQVFAKLKHFLREAAERTAPATWRRIGTLLVHRQAEDMTAPTIKRNAAKKPLISGRRPDMTRPREVLCLADRFSSWPWGTGRAVSACRPANTDATSHTTHSCRAPGGRMQPPWCKQLWARLEKTLLNRPGWNHTRAEPL